MANPLKKSFQDMETELSRDHSREILDAESVRGAAVKTMPITFRASEPLLKSLDALAQKEHRTRANLIQHILWTYIHERESSTKRG